MINKWNKKYLKLAKSLAEDNDSCYSRTIGSVLVSKDNLVIGLGYNGQAVGVPHPDSKQYLEHLWNIINDLDRKTLSNKGVNSQKDLIDKYENCKQCPRRILDIPSGERLDLCGCSHSERNAIYSAAVNGQHTKGSVLYCYCQVPCHECAIGIIQARVKKVVCGYFGHPLYSASSPGLFKMAGIELEVVNPETFETLDKFPW